MIRQRSAVLLAGVIAIIIVGFAVPVRGQGCPEEWGSRSLQSWPSSPSLLEVSGSHVFLAGDYCCYAKFTVGFVEILDVSDPEGPRVVGEFLPNGRIEDIAVSADRLYMLVESLGHRHWHSLLVVDASNPAQIEILSKSEPLVGFPTQVVAANGIIYLAGIDGLRIIDATDPEAFDELGFLAAPGEPSGLVVEGRFAYLADPVEGLRIIDVSDPTQPVEVGSWAANWQAIDLVVSDGVAYVADGPGGLRLVDVTNPAAPTEVGFLETPGDAHVVSVENHVVTVGLADVGYWVVDVTDPANPERVGVFAPDESAQNIAVVGGTAYAVVGASDQFSRGGFRVVDLSTSDSIVEMASFGFHASAMDVVAENNGLYVAGGDSGLFVQDRSNPGRTLNGVLDTPGYARGVALHDRFALVADDHKGLRIVDVSVPENLVEVGFLDTPGQSLQVEAAGNYAYVADGPGGLRIADITDPANPIEVASVATPSPALDVVVSGDYAYVAHGSLLVIDISDPIHPLEVMTTSNFLADRVAVDDHLLYLAHTNRRGQSYGLTTVTIANPGDPRFLAGVISRGEPTDIEVVGGHVFVAFGPGASSDTGGLEVFDDQTAIMPTRIGRWDCVGHPVGVAVTDNRIYVVDRTADVRILDGRCLTTYWVGIVVNEKGLKGCDWRSDVVISNGGDRIVPIEFILHTADGKYSRGAVVEPGHQGVFEDIVGMFGYEGKGALEIQALLPVSIMSRVSTVAGSGTVGTYFPGVRSSECSGSGHLYGLRELEGEFRSNIGITNTTTRPGWVRISLHRSDGKRLTEYVLDVGPEAVVIDVQPFKFRAGQPDLGWGYATVSSGDGVMVCGFVIDSRTNDPVVVPLQTATP